MDRDQVEKLARDWLTVQGSTLGDIALQFRTVDERELSVALGRVAGELSGDFVELDQFENLTKKLGKVIIKHTPENFKEGIYTFVNSIDMQTLNPSVKELRLRERIATTIIGQLTYGTVENIDIKKDYLIRAVTDFDTLEAEMKAKKIKMK